MHYSKLNSLEIPQILENLEIQQNVLNIAALKSIVSKENSSSVSKPFRSNHFSFILIKKGILNLKVNLFEYILKENEIIIIPPTSIRQFSFDGTVEYYALLFTPQFLMESGFYQKHFKLFPFFSDESKAYLSLEVVQVEFFTRLVDLIKIKITATENKKADDNIIELLFQAFLLELIYQYEQINSENSSINKNDLIYRFLTTLPKFFRENREVKFYANKLYVNPKYLTQVLTKKTGKSARDYINEIVLLEAKVLLDNPKNTIRDIAEDLNFSDQFHFTNFFKKNSGMTPTKYRNKI